MLEAEENNFPVNSAVESLQTIISDTKKCIDVIQNMDFKKNKFTLKLSLKELSDFITKIDDSVCIIPKRKKLSSLLEAGIEFTKEAILLLRKPIATNDPKSLKCLIKHGKAICIELPHLILLETRLEQALWYRKVEKLSNSEPKPTFEAIKLLLSQGMILTPDSFIENQLTELQDIIREANDWEVNARKWLQRKENMEVDTGQGILEV